MRLLYRNAVHDCNSTADDFAISCRDVPLVSIIVVCNYQGHVFLVTNSSSTFLKTTCRELVSLFMMRDLAELQTSSRLAGPVPNKLLTHKRRTGRPEVRHAKLS
ncbi:hypothetical protein EVAR_22285_1 [Eumeta japonica]|uniref:Uncharacterized protein n=1 Tax=Eumeta variegata TaxID=151549 RepID=A0A4C1UBU7_EUMVA|nr:hypothetical protein EVAR_22285_1 [Eumeta japonica]